MATGIMQPWMPPQLEELAGGVEVLMEYKEREERLEEKHIVKLDVLEEDLEGLCVSKVLFENCSFQDCSFVKAEFTDVIFQSCDFSNSNFSDGYFNRCRFLSSKGLGARFCGSMIQNVVIKDCNLNYVNFDSSKLEKIRIEETQMTGGNISQCKCKAITWTNVTLESASFFKTPLRGMDFTTCNLTGLSLSDELTELKGAVVDLYQAAELAKRLGLVIKS
ncbi:MAG: pentapeptide repeat-containing protein [Hungatella hathewayi]|nr:pentapeptide repeat-containing protein [Hungatella hathewayi]